jgi:Family of unknown function (DUF6056)
VLLFTLGVYAYLGRYTRYVADDFTLKNDLHASGYWAAQIWEYLHWTGRFSYIALMDGGLLLGELFVRFLPGILLLLWVLAISAAVKALVPKTGWIARLTLASGVVFTTLHMTPSPFLSLYWMAGSLEYTAPLLLGSFLVAIVASRSGGGRSRIVAAGLVAFVAGGFNEGYAFAQLLILVLMLLATFTINWPELSRSRSLLLFGLVGSVVSLVVLGVAPGNGARFSVITEIIGTRPSFVELPRVTVGFALQFFNDVFVARWGALLFVGAISALVAGRTTDLHRTSAAQQLQRVVYILLVAVVTSVASFAPTAYVEARITPIYGQIVPAFIGVCAVAVVGWACGRYAQSVFDHYGEATAMRPEWRSVLGATAVVALSCLVATVPIHSIITIWGDRGALSAYAATKDQQAAMARAAAVAGSPSVTVPSTSTTADLGVFSHPSYEEMLPDPNWWINKGEAEYYGVGAISAGRHATAS